ncbi:HlyD family efflux transporter periplasmic adaptor subunit [Nitrincola iocasae]|uniref:HlyD family efflux transporter periplasmic adaptor subunit n=1 Tax=Nitrincola iocasae TaxID=2614693 RepID=A0A5J6LF18_9GAMM|nr:HlyD family efflux transporter periplasmic adaptor subunit [Nitrincola iocasae]QEW06791.1 HlyD family efflux transporter periplasmic adaptor subunit [Nitrincola iocasae]
MKPDLVKSNSDIVATETSNDWLRQLQQASESDFFVRWLALLRQELTGLDEAVLVLGPADQGPFKPVVTHPPHTPCSSALMRLCEQVMQLRRPLSQRSESVIHWVVPIQQGDALLGVFGLTAKSLSVEQRQWLQWGLGWILTRTETYQHAGDSELSERLMVLLDLLMSSVGGQSLQDACQAVLSQAAVNLDCDRIALGFGSGRSVRMVTLSNSAEFTRRIDLVQSIESAMNEAVDQGHSLCWPLQQASLDTFSAHQALIREQGNHTVLTVPFMTDTENYGAICFEWAEVPDERQPELAESIASVVGRVLLEKRQSELSLLSYLGRRIKHIWKRLVGPRYLGTKLLVLLLILMSTFFVLAEGTFRLSADARLEGALNRSLSAPFDSYVMAAHYRAGQTVEEGEVLAELDDRDLRLEQLRWQSQLAQFERQMRLSQAQRDTAQARVAAAQIEQAEAQLALSSSLLNRTQIRAPFTALITRGDLSQDLGLPVTKGQVLFELAPLDEYRLVLDLSETDMAHIHEGQKGQLVLKAFPEVRIDFEVIRVTPVAEARDGKNLFRVEAEIAQLLPAMRPGMEGVAKVEVSQQRLIWIWTRTLVDWSRLQLWKWLGR